MASEHAGYLSRWLRLGMFLLALCALVVVAVVVLFDWTNSSAAWVAVAVIFVVAVILALGPDGLKGVAQRVQEFSLGGLTVKLAPGTRDDARQAALTTPALADDEEGDDRKDDDPPPARLVDLRLNLDQKMTYIAKHMLGSESGSSEPKLQHGTGEERDATFITIGSLLLSEYINEEQARTLDRLSTMNGEVFAALSKQDRSGFFRDAKKVVHGLRLTVFRAMVGKVLGTVDPAYSEVKRPDLKRTVYSCCPDSGRVFVVPVFSIGGSGPVTRTVAESEEITRLQHDCSDPMLFAVPRTSAEHEGPLETGIGTLVKFPHLASRLRELGRSSRTKGKSYL